MRPDKRWSKHHADTRDLFCPRVGEEKTTKKIVKKPESDNVKKPPTKAKGVSLSASMSSSDSLSVSRQKVSDPRLNRTLSLENKTSKPKTSRMKISDRIEQSAKTKAVKQKTPEAFVEIDPVLPDDYVDEPDLNVQDVISHLRQNITPYTSVDSHSETVRSPSSDNVFESRDLSPSKGKKKKANYLKKQSEAKKQTQDTVEAQDSGGKEKNVKLFTRAQTARFSKSDSTEEDSVTLSDENGKSSIQDIISCIQNGCSDAERNEQILIVQHELTAGVGYDNLRKVLDIISMISDEQEMQMHITHILGPKLFEEYKEHLTVLRLLEGKS
ncbi:uncharacterized protein LOC132742324 [Ruditapes philippinarum]|uniref:uncharacterized protein LOC132742324 n=1 Tax=Ruditapes philippinarum TaxID=129788 RepID=UPI00295B42C1|nr:uncharacterized protein LOC132742324 [Ruditapes philippinarum]